MSVTFAVDDTPYKDEILNEGTDDAFICSTPVEPFIDINLSNTNARMFLEVFGIDSDELCGKISVEQAKSIGDKMKRRLEDSDFSGLLRETVKDGNFTFIGTDREYVLTRVSQFLTLFTLAIEHNKDIHYA